MNLGQAIALGLLPQMRPIPSVAFLPDAATTYVSTHKIADEPETDRQGEMRERSLLMRKLKQDVLLAVANEGKPICAVVVAKRLGNENVQRILCCLREACRQSLLLRAMVSGVYHYSVNKE